MMETIILNLIYLSFPLTLYIIYNMYANLYQKEVNDLLSTFLIGTSFYFLIRFGSLEFSSLPFLLSNVPLLISYIRKNSISIFLLSLINLFYYFSFGYSSFFVIIYLLLIYFLYRLFIKKIINKNYFILGFLIIYLLLILIESNGTGSVILFIYFLLNFVLSYFIVLLFENSEKMARIHKTFQEIEHEKEVRLSIFKITHEIKNPIAVCKGYLDMFDISNLEHSKNYIPIIRSEIDRTLCLLQDFLELNKIKIEKEEMDLTILLEELKDSCAPLLKDKKIEFRMDNLEDEIYLQGDFNRLKQVCINVIKNSIESLENRIRPFICVTYHIKKNYVYLYIEDNGCGMSREVVKKIKDPFFTTKMSGSGLGVTISSEIIRAHEGIIRYSSKENIGTKVEIILPLQK